MLYNVRDFFHIFLFRLAIPVLEELAYLELEYWRLEKEQSRHECTSFMVSGPMAKRGKWLTEGAANEEGLSLFSTGRSNWGRMKDLRAYSGKNNERTHQRDDQRKLLWRRLRSQRFPYKQNNGAGKSLFKEQEAVGLAMRLWYRGRPSLTLFETSVYLLLTLQWVGYLLYNRVVEKEDKEIGARPALAKAIVAPRGYLPLMNPEYSLGLILLSFVTSLRPETETYHIIKNRSYCPKKNDFNLRVTGSERGSSTTEDQLALPHPKLAHEHSKPPIFLSRNLRWATMLNKQRGMLLCHRLISAALLGRTSSLTLVLNLRLHRLLGGSNPSEFEFHLPPCKGYGTGRTKIKELFKLSNASRQKCPLKRTDSATFIRLCTKEGCSWSFFRRPAEVLLKRTSGAACAIPKVKVSIEREPDLRNKAFPRVHLADLSLGMIRGILNNSSVEWMASFSIEMLAGLMNTTPKTGDSTWKCAYSFSYTANQEDRNLNQEEVGESNTESPLECREVSSTFLYMLMKGCGRAMQEQDQRTSLLRSSYFYLSRYGVNIFHLGP
ncbi:hypothetical protein M9H77_27047 [Catharanthus roseus]|uniref:Uncharacterized protein n=1 Tax=Catharanthus roseus TaxID=4058 RepID=A0ACC0ABU0_CATRO|nr:hypothetical protein M9H77_27047 [Catharanthus roseus]